MDGWLDWMYHSLIEYLEADSCVNFSYIQLEGVCLNRVECIHAVLLITWQTCEIRITEMYSYTSSRSILIS